MKELIWFNLDIDVIAWGIINEDLSDRWAYPDRIRIPCASTHPPTKRTKSMEAATLTRSTEAIASDWSGVKVHAAPLLWKVVPKATLELRKYPSLSVLRRRRPVVRTPMQLLLFCHCRRFELLETLNFTSPKYGGKELTAPWGNTSARSTRTQRRMWYSSRHGKDRRAREPFEPNLQPFFASQANDGKRLKFYRLLATCFPG